MMRRLLGTLAAMALLMTAIQGCASSGETPHPMDAIEAYKSAVENKDAEAVYALLDEPARLGMDKASFEVYFAEHHAAILAQAQRMTKRARQTGALQIEAQVPVAGSIAPVVWAEDQWFLARENPTRSSQDTPRDTLEALLRTLSVRDLEGVMGLLSHERRTVYVQEMDVLRESLEGSLDNIIVTDGDTAILPLDNGDKVLLIREDGVWKLQGYEQAED